MIRVAVESINFFVDFDLLHNLTFVELSSLAENTPTKTAL